MINQQQIIEAAIRELEEQTWSVTVQYMQIHDVVQEDGIPKVARVDMEREDKVAIVYFPVQGEKFYLAVYLDTEPDIHLRNVGTESNNRIYLRVTSDTLTLDQICALTTLQATDGWNNGDFKKNGKAVYTYSCAIYEPNPEPDSFEDKLEKLLNYLEQDKEGIAGLSTHAEYAYIQADLDIHNGNGLIGGPFINRQNIKRMSYMDLEVAVSQHVSGNPFRD